MPDVGLRLIVESKQVIAMDVTRVGVRVCGGAHLAPETARPLRSLRGSEAVGLLP